MLAASSINAVPTILLEGRCPHHQGGRSANSRHCSSSCLRESLSVPPHLLEVRIQRSLPRRCGKDCRQQSISHVWC